MKNWLVTGDIHGHIMDRLSAIDHEMYPHDGTTGVIVLGDAGINFYLNKVDVKNKRIINKSGYIIYCVRGNHEERPENISTMVIEYDPEVKGEVYVEPAFPNIRYLRDGKIYQFASHSALVIGGAYSVDKWYRLSMFKGHGWTGWFKDEQLTEEEMNEISTDMKDKKVDIVLSHTCPASWQPFDLFISGVDQSKVDKTMENWLDSFKDTFDWSIWLFGHFHDDRLVRPGVEMFFRDIENIENIWWRWNEE